MKKTKKISYALLALPLAACLIGCSAAAASVLPHGSGETSALPSESTSMYDVAYAKNGVEDAAHDAAVLKEQLKNYEEFGMVYDSDKDVLYYNGKLVRWFEDYYELSAEERAGIDFFNENGVVDVYAVRDFSNLIQNDDGSFDPSGKIIGLKEFSDKEFAERDINAIKNPPRKVCYAGGGPLTPDEAQAIADEYAAFGVTYDASIDQWYFNGEKVRFFQDVLTSNSESLTGGNFHGAIRSSWNENGSIDIYTVRDFANLNTSGNGTLTGVEKFSQAEFDEHTQREFNEHMQREVQTSSGECVVIQE